MQQRISDCKGCPALPRSCPLGLAGRTWTHSRVSSCRRMRSLTQQWVKVCIIPSVHHHQPMWSTKCARRLCAVSDFFTSDSNDAKVIAIESDVGM